jgi:hypothetical protein
MRFQVRCEARYETVKEQLKASREDVQARTGWRLIGDGCARLLSRPPSSRARRALRFSLATTPSSRAHCFLAFIFLRSYYNTPETLDSRTRSAASHARRIQTTTPDDRARDARLRFRCGIKHKHHQQASNSSLAVRIHNEDIELEGVEGVESRMNRPLASW